jgi:hypothetical protein
MKAKNLLLTLAVGAMAISCNNSGSMTQTSASLKTSQFLYRLHVRLRPATNGFLRG